MRALIKIAICVMNIIYYFMKWIPTRNQVVFLSRQHDSSNMDFDQMIQYMNKVYPEYKCKVLARQIHEGFFSKIMYAWHVFVQMHELAKSRVVIIDTYCIPVSVLRHKKSLTVIQIWHAVGAMKRFGYSVVDKEEGSSSTIAESMHMHRNYDYVCASSEFCRPFFAEAFDVELDKVVTYPLPRLDKLSILEMKNTTIKKIYMTYPELENSAKKIVLYAPTFRKGEGDVEEAIKELISCFDFEQYHLIIKTHPLSSVNIEDPRVMWRLDFETSDLILVSDYIVTDYSAIVYEAAVAQKPILFYAIDYETYVVNRDFYTEYKSSIPGILHESGGAIMEAITNDDYDEYAIREFKERYIKESDESYVGDLVQFIMSHLKAM